MPSYATLLACALSLLTAIGSPPALAANVEDDISRCWDKVTSRPELASCLQSLLTEVEGKLAAAEAGKEKSLASMNDSSAGARIAAFKQVRPAFIQYRERLCNSRRMIMEPGTGAGDAYVACMIRTTQYQLEQVERD